MQGTPTGKQYSQAAPGRSAPKSSGSVSNAINMEYSDYDEREIDRIMRSTGYSRSDAAGLHFKTANGVAAGPRAQSPLDRRPSLPGERARSPLPDATRRPSARDLSPARLNDPVSRSSLNGVDASGRSRSPVPAVIPGGRQPASSSPLRSNYVSSPPLEANGMFPPHSTAPVIRDRSPGPGGKTQSAPAVRPAGMQRSHTTAINGASSFLDERSHSSDQVRMFAR